jgi:hypothetical protein
MQKDARAHTHTNQKSTKSLQHTHARTHKQIHTRNFAAICASMTVPWLTGLLGLKQLDKYKRDRKCNVARKSIRRCFRACLCGLDELD